MSFFKKLKERLTRSSSKLDEDLGELFEGGDTAPAIEDVKEEPTVTEPEIENAQEPVLEEVTEDPLPKDEPKPAVKKVAPEKKLEPTPEPPKKKRRAFGLLPAKEDVPPAPKKPEISEADKRKHVLDDEMLEGLEETLIMSDIGGDMALKISAALSAEKFGKTIMLHEMKSIMAREMAAVLEPVAKPMPLGTARPQIVLVVGVNGSGKTTTIGKLALQFKSSGKSVMVAACDTFRAAAVEQLAIWGERAGVPVMRAEMNSDPASLAFDAMKRATDEGTDILMVDTAGRLQNRTDLMEELGKIKRVLSKQDEAAPHNTILVLDATTGQNALKQVEEFSKVADVTGLVMTKLDGTAKGGILVALAHKFGKPIHAIGVGESIDDLQPFDPQEFANALAGLN